MSSASAGLRERLDGAVGCRAPGRWQANYERSTRPTAAAVGRELEPANTHCGRHRNHVAARALGGIVGYSFAWKPGHAVYVPVAAPEGEPQSGSRRRRSARCGLCWRTRGSRKWVRI